MDTTTFQERLAGIVGRRHLHLGEAATGRFRKGWRSGEGEAEAAVEPGSLVELWRVLKLCVEADRIVIMQAQNTGLTEGSTPSGRYDRPVTVISTLRMDRILVLDEGRQIVSLPGGTLHALEKRLKPYGRQPHSVIGSSCIGASIMGGVCNNSGGALVRRGPVYTELSLFARRTADDRLELVNHLGVDLGDEGDPEAMLARLDRGEVADADLRETERRASDDGYQARVREVDADTPGRFNADPTTLYESSGSAGKMAVLAVRLDTFPAETRERVYYVGTNDPAALERLRRELLTTLDPLPISGEYLHREIFDVTKVYGKDTMIVIDRLGTDWLPWIFKWKGRIDAWANAKGWLPNDVVDRTMQGLSRLWPEVLPKRMRDFRAAYEHHLILKMGENAEAAEPILDAAVGREGWFACEGEEAQKAMLFRFAAAGAAARYAACNPAEVEDILALDIALRRNDADWFETLPEDVARDVVARLYYGHFLCHVFHQDYAIRKGADPARVKARMLEILDARGAEYPAEHNVGHLYEAKPALREHYERLDPTNSFNPGIGKTSKQKRTREAAQEIEKA